MDRREFIASLVAGGCAGMCVDLTLFPLDTIKTRLQSQQGFHKAGGFRGIYAGVPSAAVGSFPNAAAFFVTYESTKSLLSASTFAASHVAPVSHMLAASLGEIVACLIRVPTEVVKQRTQASPSSTTYNMLLATLREEGVRGLYRGYGSTVLREEGNSFSLGLLRHQLHLPPSACRTCQDKFVCVLCHGASPPRCPANCGLFCALYSLVSLQEVFVMDIKSHK
ncbi:hypothetical protein XENOCAPTIV_027657 [Xenoophorus captivus]|uniref:Mitochondrial S-adenosylmethionine carrier protein n=1 Tax=Xenoophorus captivus TaxID=1517983 RepID=A0ABV0S9E1_9TELE